MSINILIQFRDTDGKPFLGRGPIGLLEEVRRCGSINQAAKNINMSYSKAHGLVKRLEAEMNLPLLEKTIGGNRGGGTILTVAGEQLIEEYSQLEDQLKNMAIKALDQTKVLKCLRHL